MLDGLKWICGTPVHLGDRVEYPCGEKTFKGEVYWDEDNKTYEVSVGTHLTLCKETIGEFIFIARAELKGDEKRLKKRNGNK